MNEFSHHGPDDQHRRFSRDSQSAAEWLAPVGSVECHPGRPIERFAQECVTDFGHPRLALDARARLLLTRVESGKGDGLTGMAEAPRSGVEGQQNGEGALPEAGNAIEQTLFVAQGRIIIDVIANGLNDPLDLLVQPLERLGDTFLDSRSGDIKTIGFLGRHRVQRLQAQHPCAQDLLGGRGACQGAGRRSAQNSAISLASALSVFVRTIRDAPKALI